MAFQHKEHPYPATLTSAKGRATMQRLLNR